MDKTAIPCDPMAGQEVKNVLEYLAGISGKKVITGQHTQTMDMEELAVIERETGKQPALLGFELLSYSPNINYLDTDDECMTEVSGNLGTLRRAWEWAEKKGLITFVWHWFSPLGGRSKSFYTRNTDFDPSKAVVEGTAEYKALISDMDMMAGLLRPFADKHVPILWRPFHEGEGDWFWWGSKGPKTLKKLYRLMFDRFTKVHGLHDLIWVWNAPLPECYPGDDAVDVISRDLYPEKHCHGPLLEQYEELIKITQAPKPVIIGEVGTLPDIDAAVEKGACWSSYMTWSKVFTLTETFTTYDYLRKTYNSPAAVTKADLPELY